MKKDIDLNSMDFCNIVLVNSGTEKIKVIKQIRIVTGSGLKEGKDCVDHTPSIIVKSINHLKAEEIKASFEALGAKIELAPLDRVLNDFIHKEELEFTLKCPICNATTIRRTTIEKPILSEIFRFFTFGKAEEIKECKQCGYKW